jgi:hypothetical protein
VPERISDTDQHQWGLIGPSHVELLLQDEACLAKWSPQWTWIYGRGAASWFYKPFIDQVEAACKACRHVLMVGGHWRHANYQWERIRDESEAKPVSEISWDYHIHEEPNLNIHRDLIYHDVAEFVLSRHMLDKLDWLLATYSNLSVCFWSIYGLEKRTRKHDRIISYEQLSRRYGHRMVNLRNLHLRYDIMTLYRDNDFHPSVEGYERMRVVFEAFMNQKEALGVMESPEPEEVFEEVE